MREIIELVLKSLAGSVHLFSVYALQSGRPFLERCRFYHQLNSILEKVPPSLPKFVFGEFDAALYFAYPSDSLFLGKWVFGRGQAYLEYLESL